MKSTSKKRLILPAIGLIGILYGVVFAISSQHRPQLPEQNLALPPSSSFEHSIAGSGLIEANTRNIAVGSHVPGIVSRVFVAEGDEVPAGAPLFMLDDRSARADLTTAESNLAVLNAQLAEAHVNLADQSDQLARVAGLKEGFAVTADRVARLRFAKSAASERVKVAEASIEEAQARLKSAQVTLEKLTVVAPTAGRILKLNTRAGEFVQAGADNPPPLVMGNDKPLHVRVMLDENDLWRFTSGAQATGALRSNKDVHFPLSFVRVEPYVIPKTSLTGASNERVDTRVLEVVYRIDSTDAPVYIGQQVDVFIDAAKKEAASAAPTAAAAPTPPAESPETEAAPKPASDAAAH